MGKKQKLTNSYKGINDLKAFRKLANKHQAAHDDLDLMLYKPFAEWYTLERITKGIPLTPDNPPKVHLLYVGDKSAVYIIEGTTKPADDFDGPAVHTREKIVHFPLDFLENKTPYVEAKNKAVAEREQAEQFITAEAARVRLEAISLEAKTLQHILTHNLTISRGE